MAQKSSSYQIELVEGREVITLAPDGNALKIVGLLALPAGLGTMWAVMVPWDEQELGWIIAAWCLWASLTVVTIYQAARIAWERVSISVGDGNLAIVSNLGGWQRETCYPLSGIHDLRALPDALGSEAATGIEFGYQGDTHTIATHLFASDCAVIIGHLAKSLPSTAMPQTSWNPFHRPQDEPKLLDHGAG